MEQVATPFEMKSIGKQWFKWRGYSPVPLLLGIFFLPADFVPTQAQYVVLVFLIVFSEGLRIWAVGYAGSATRTRNAGTPSLVHNGPFRFVRNPLYVANILMYVSISLLFGYLYLSFAALVYFAVQYTFIVSFEEGQLQEIFGQAYQEYMAQVHRWLPTLSPIPPSDHAFELTKSLRSERSSLLALALVGLLFYALRLQS